LEKKDIPIIALTAYSREEEEKKCYEVGMNNLVTKPFKMHQLLNAITKIISLKSSEIIDNQEDNNKSPVIHENRVDFTFMEDFTERNKEDMVYFIKKFIQTIPAAIEKLSTAIDENDAVKIKKIAHTITPQIEFVGIKKGLDNIKILENKILEPNYDIIDIKTIFDEICKNIDEGKVVLENFTKN
jgi:response regulator RpfG family c-di-GMP phosphodiesterase